MSRSDAEPAEKNNRILTENDISRELMGIFIKIHSRLGPGLLESVYEEVICYELTQSQDSITNVKKAFH